MDRVERSYYPDGHLKEEIHFRDGKEHGPWRLWHPNGQLAEEYWFENGLYGTSISRTWDENGMLRSEAPTVNGRQVGRFTVFTENGSILIRKYFLEDGEVSREEYEAACDTRPELHRYTDEPPLKGPRKTPQKKEPSSKARQHTARSNERRPDVSGVEANERAFVEDLLSGKTSEALAWLLEGRDGAKRGLGEMGAAMSREFVEKWYEIGAVGAWAVQIEVSPFDGDETTNHLLVELPQEQRKREKLFELEREHARSQGLDGEPDRGQRFLYLGLC
jgi:hypothetical protein